MTNGGRFAASVLASFFWIGCSTTVVAQRPFTEPSPGAQGPGDHCRSTEDCVVGTCQAGYCIGNPSRRPIALEEINGVLEGRSAEVELAPELQSKPLNAQEVKVGVDRTQWVEGQQLKSVPTDALRTISFKKRIRGAADGLGLGALAGLANGALIGTVWAIGTGCLPYEQCTPKVFGSLVLTGAAFGALLGAPIGALIGLAVGHRTTIEFDSRPPSP